MMDLLELYSTDEDFKRYVDKYCEKHGKTAIETLLDNIVQEVGICYKFMKKLNGLEYEKEE